MCHRKEADSRTDQAERMCSNNTWRQGECVPTHGDREKLDGQMPAGLEQREREERHETSPEGTRSPEAELHRTGRAVSPICHH